MAARIGGDRSWQAIAWLVGPILVLLVAGVSTVDPIGGQDLAARFVILLPLFARQRWPTAVLMLVAGLAMVTAAVTPSPWITAGAVAVAAFSMGELGRDRTRGALVVVVVSALISLSLLVQDADVVESTVLPILVLVPAWLLGDVVRTRRLDAAARIAERERERRDADARLQAAVTNERRTMARELHDVVAHAVSVMVIQAGAARQVLDRPERASEALLTVEATGREAMSELRQLLGLLNDEGEVAALTPQPGLDQITTLIDRVREAGLPAELEIAGTPQAISMNLDVAIYRIVQEALTNALRYARMAATLVRLTWEPTQLRVEILDDGPGGAAGATVGAGRGLVGMRERASQVGGRLEAGPRLGGGYAVRAWLPLGSALPLGTELPLETEPS